MTLVKLIFDIKDQTWIDSNPEFVADVNEPVFKFDGTVFYGDNVTELQNAIWLPLFSGGGSVNSVTGTHPYISVDNTDPQNPIITIDNAYLTGISNVINNGLAGKQGLLDGYGFVVGYGGTVSYDTTSYQPLLVSATNIKTINGVSLLDSGDLVAAIWGGIQGNVPDQVDLVNYIQAVVSTVIRDRGNYDASTNHFPSSGGSGPGGLIQLGNQWTVSVSGTLGGELVNSPYDTIRALVDSPSDVRSDWYIQHSSSPVVNPSTTTITKIITGTTVTPFFGTENNLCIVTQLASDTVIKNPTGFISEGYKLMIRITPNGTARLLSFDPIYNFSSDLSKPTTTTANKTLCMGFMYNAQTGKLDCLAILDNI